MKNYKIVNVYFGYSEFGIEDVMKVCGNSKEEVRNERLNELMKDWEEGDMVFEKSGDDVIMGEENYEIVFEEGDEMYSLVKGNSYDYKYGKEDWDRWVKFCEGK